MAMDKSRLGVLVEQMKKDGLDGLLLAPSEDMVFLIGSTPMMCERFQAMLITPDGDYCYICNLLYEGELRAALGQDAKIYPWFDGDGFTPTVQKVFEQKGLIGKKIGVNVTVRAFNTYEISAAMDVTFVSARNLPNESRIFKSDEDLAALRAVEAITGEAFQAVLPKIKPGLTEAEVRDMLFEEMAARGGYKQWAIIASGPNGSFPHYHAYSRVLEKGDSVVIDFGCVLNKLCSDCTRTIFLGQPSDKQKEVYDIVKRAQAAGCAAAVEGAWIPDIDKAARDVIIEAGYGQYFTTRVGHGIGYQIHEAPDIKQSNPRKLERRMAFSIEPGIYITGEFGVRIEDIVFVDGNGKTNVLSTQHKDMIVVDC